MGILCYIGKSGEGSFGPRGRIEQGEFAQGHFRGAEGAAIARVLILRTVLGAGFMVQGIAIVVIGFADKWSPTARTVLIATGAVVFAVGGCHLYFTKWEWRDRCLARLYAEEILRLESMFRQKRSDAEVWAYCNGQGLPTRLAAVLMRLALQRHFERDEARGSGPSDAPPAA